MIWGQEYFLLPNPDLADILGNTDLAFENFYFLNFCWIPNFQISRFQISRDLARARLGPGLGLGWVSKHDSKLML